MDAKSQSLEDDVVHDVLPEAVEDGLDRNGPDSRRKKNPVGCSRSLWAMYQQAVSERPILTKSITAAVVSAFGEVVGSALKTSSSITKESNLLLVSNTSSRGLSSSLAEIASGGGMATGAERSGDGGGGVGVGGIVVESRSRPGLLRRTAAFAIFGLLINGPLFNWWYGALERIAARCRKPGRRPGNAREVALKVALDRLLLTPPYLAVTLVVLRLLQGQGLRRSARETRALYRGVLITNWKVWTLAQLINFNLVPVEFRPIFGNLVACWWNIYLSLISNK